MSEIDIAKRFPAMSLEDTLKKEEEEPPKRKNEEDSEMEERVEFKGVSWWRGVYAATILKASSDDIRWLGRYKSAETAAMVHDVAAYRIFGADYDGFNFPSDICHIMNMTRKSPSTNNNNLKQEQVEYRVEEFIGVNMLGDDMYAAALSEEDSLGTYKSPETAAMVHDVAAYMIFGANHHAFNFPRSISLVMEMSRSSKKKQQQTGF